MAGETLTDPVQINAVKVACYVPVAVDADGTPLSHGEPMTETEPGVWVDPVIAAVTDFLEAAAGETLG
jgi:hypothetical protein